MDKKKAKTLIISACVVISLYMTWNINIYTWKFRLTKLISLLLIAYTISVSTVLFQTVVNNHLLTPSIMGFDQLYILIKTIRIYFLGSLSLPFLNEEGQLMLEAFILIIFSISLFRWLFSESLKGLHLTLLIGVVLGSFFQLMHVHAMAIESRPNDEFNGHHVCKF